MTLYDVINLKNHFRQLQRQLTQTKKAKDLEVHEMTEMIAHLKDQLQEMKSKSNLESKYVKKSAENSLDMNSTLKNIEETDLKVKKNSQKVKSFEKIKNFKIFL